MQNSYAGILSLTMLTYCKARVNNPSPIRIIHSHRKEKHLKKRIIFEKHLTNGLIFGIIPLVHRGIAQLVEYWSPKPWVVGSSPSAPAKERGIGRISGLFLFLLLWAGGLEGEAVVNDSLNGCQSRGTALPAGKEVLLPLPKKEE